MDKIYANASSDLLLFSETKPRIILLSEDILRYYKYLENSNTSLAYSIYGDELSNYFVNLSKSLKLKREQYWKAHRDGTPLQNIRYCLLDIFATDWDDQNNDIDFSEDGMIKIENFLIVRFSLS